MGKDNETLTENRKDEIIQDFVSYIIMTEDQDEAGDILQNVLEDDELHEYLDDDYYDILIASHE